MINFSKIPAITSLTPEWILSRVDEFTIMRYYFGDFSVGKAYCSFFDKKDTRPSTGFYINKKGSLIYRDFRNGKTWNCFDFVKEIYNCNFKRALEIIANDFGLINIATLKVSKQVFEEAQQIERQNKAETLIQFIPEKWNKLNLSFWNYYEITQSELEENGVYPVNRLFINKNEIYNKNNILRYAYIIEHEGKQLIKVYSPFDKNMKWLSNVPLDVPFGLNKLVYNSDTVFITKSLKDLIVLKKLFYNVIATQNESEAALNSSVQEHLKSKFDKRIIIFDNDDVGVENCKKFNDKGFDYFNIPKDEYYKYKIKDPSDYIKFYGIDALKDLFKTKGIICQKDI